MSVSVFVSVPRPIFFYEFQKRQVTNFRSMVARDAPAYFSKIVTLNLLRNSSTLLR